MASQLTTELIGLWMREVREQRLPKPIHRQLGGAVLRIAPLVYWRIRGPLWWATLTPEQRSAKWRRFYSSRSERYQEAKRTRDRIRVAARRAMATEDEVARWRDKSHEYESRPEVRARRAAAKRRRRALGLARN